MQYLIISHTYSKLQVIAMCRLSKRGVWFLDLCHADVGHISIHVFKVQSLGGRCSGKVERPEWLQEASDVVVFSYWAFVQFAFFNVEHAWSCDHSQSLSQNLRKTGGLEKFQRLHTLLISIIMRPYQKIQYFSWITMKHHFTSCGCNACSWEPNWRHEKKLRTKPYAKTSILHPKQLFHICIISRRS